MASLPSNIIELSNLLSSLPGVGPKLSTRLALYLSLSGKKLATSISESMKKSIEAIRPCDLCGNVTTEKLCNICSDESRERSILLIVEDSLDLYNIEGAGDYNGLYHVLNGVISPVNGIGPKDINLDSLLKRVESGDIKEVIIGLNPNIEGESTGMYIKQSLMKLSSDVKFTRLARGIPSGSDIEFMSSQTIGDSVKSRIEF